MASVKDNLMVDKEKLELSIFRSLNVDLHSVRLMKQNHKGIALLTALFQGQRILKSNVIRLE